MQPPKPPKITAVEVAAAQPTEADSAAIARLSAQTNRSLPQVVYVVKIELSAKPPATSMAWALYVNDVLIPKYWEYKDGIYFTVIDSQFFADHKGKRLRFSQNGVDFHDTGIKLPGPATLAAPSRSKRKVTKSKGAQTKATKASAARLPTQDEVLKLET
jgi:hypothetical protein